MLVSDSESTGAPSYLTFSKAVTGPVFLSVQVFIKLNIAGKLFVRQYSKITFLRHNKPSDFMLFIILTFASLTNGLPRHMFM